MAEKKLQSFDIEPIAVRLDEAAQLIGVSRGKLYTMISAGEFGPAIIKFGSRSVVCYDELKNWIAAGAPPRQEWLRRGKQ